MTNTEPVNTAGAVQAVSFFGWHLSGRKFGSAKGVDKLSMTRHRAAGVSLVNAFCFMECWHELHEKDQMKHIMRVFFERIEPQTVRHLWEVYEAMEQKILKKSRIVQLVTVV